MESETEKALSNISNDYWAKMNRIVNTRRNYSYSTDHMNGNSKEEYMDMIAELINYNTNLEKSEAQAEARDRLIEQNKKSRPELPDV